MEKISADEFRDMSIKEIQRTITDLQKKKSKIFVEEPGRGAPVQPSESLGTLKRNIARAKTVLNERLNQEVKA